MWGESVEKQIGRGREKVSGRLREVSVGVGVVWTNERADEFRPEEGEGVCVSIRDMSARTSQPGSCGGKNGEMAQRRARRRGRECVRVGEDVPVRVRVGW
jgi:hypothetical protein